MKRNLSKNFIKSLAIALSVTLGSAAAISTAMVSNQAVEVSAASLDIQNNQFVIKTSSADVDISNMFISVNKTIDNQEYDLLFKVTTTTTAEAVGTATAAAGRATLVGLARTDANTQLVADGTNVPLKGTLSGATITLSDLKNDATAANTQARLTVDKIGITGTPLKGFTIQTGAVPAEGTLQSISAKVLNEIFSYPAVEVSSKAFKDIVIEDGETTPIVVPSTTKLKDYIFDSQAKTAENNFTLDLSANSTFTAGTELTSNTFKSDSSSNDQNKIKVILKDNAAITSFNTTVTVADNTNVTRINQKAIQENEINIELPKGPKDTSVFIGLTNSMEFDSSGFPANQQARLKIQKKGTTTAYTATALVVDSGKLKATFAASDLANFSNGDEIEVIYTEDIASTIKTTAATGAKELTSFKLTSTIAYENPATVSTVKLDTTGAANSDHKKLNLEFDKQLLSTFAVSADLKKDFSIVEVKKDGVETPLTITTITPTVASGLLAFEVDAASKFKIGTNYKISYKPDTARPIEDVVGNTIQGFDNFVVENKLGKATETFKTTNYLFKILTDLSAANPTVELTSSNADPKTFNATLLNGEVEFENGLKATITEIGNSANSILQGVANEMSKEELLNITSKATKIKTKAFDNVVIKLPKATASSTLVLPLVTDVEVNGLGFSAGVDTVQFAASGITTAKVVNNAFANSTAGGTSSIKTVKLPSDANTITAANLGVDKVIIMGAAPVVNDEIKATGETFMISSIDSIADDSETIGEASLLSISTNNTPADVVLKDGLITYKVDTNTPNVKSEYLYNLSSLGKGTQADVALDVTPDTFKETGLLNKSNIKNIVNLNHNVFEGKTLPSELIFENGGFVFSGAFKNTKGLETLVLNGKNIDANNGIDADAFEGSSVKTIKLNLDNKNLAILGLKFQASAHPNVQAIKLESTQDLAGPTVQTAVVKNNSKNVIEMTFDENVELFEEGKLPESSDFKVTSNNKSKTVNKIEIKDKVIKLTLRDNFAAGENNFKVNYTQGQNKLSDASKNLVQNFEAMIKNEITASTQSGGSSSGGSSSSGSGGSFDITGTNTQNTPQNNNSPTTQNTPQNNTVVKKDLTFEVIKLPQLSEEAKEFSDIKATYWAKPSIEKLSKAGIISGDADGKFNADGKTKRADVAIMLVKLLGLQGEPKSNFSDVNSSKYYAKYVGLAREYGIINGSNGKFNPESSISRQDTMVMVAQILKGLNLDVNTETKTLEKFSDLSNFSGYAKESAAILVNSGVVNGSNGKLNPKAPVTRAEMATIIAKIYDMLEANQDLIDASKAVEDAMP